MNLSEIKDYARKNSVPIMFDETQNFICDFIRQNNVKTILEIGTAIGYSAIQFAKVSSQVQVVTIEIDIDRFILAKENVEKNGLLSQISLNHCDALEFHTEQKFDLIFIDAAKAQYVKFFEKFKNNLAENGTIISDNLFFHGMVQDMSLTHNYSTIKLVRKIRKYVSFLKSNPEFTTVFHDLGDGISTSTLNINYVPITPEITPSELEGTFRLSDNGKILAIFQFQKETLFVKKFSEDKTVLKESIRLLKILAEEKNLHSITTPFLSDLESAGFFKDGLNSEIRF